MKIPPKVSVLLLALLLFGTAVGLGFLARQHVYLSGPTHDLQDMLASVFFTQSVTVPGLEAKYNSQQKIKILIVPGHEPDDGGTEFNGIKERDIVLDLAADLENYLSTNSHYEVISSRDKNGWNPDLVKYWSDNSAIINAFVLSQKADMLRLIASGQITKVTDGVKHNAAATAVARRLFGINKWADDQGVDVTINIHFNDYDRSRLSKPGIYHGFTIYVPDAQYSNAAATRTMADNVFTRLSQVEPVSDLPVEDAGVVGDQDLIALGTNNTVNGVSMLIEYAYIYEPELSDPTGREKIMDSMAKQTYLGIQDFFTGTH